MRIGSNLRCPFAQRLRRLLPGPRISHISPDVLTFLFEETPPNLANGQDYPRRNPGFISALGGQVCRLAGLDERSVLDVPRVMVSLPTPTAQDIIIINSENVLLGVGWRWSIGAGKLRRFVDGVKILEWPRVAAGGESPTPRSQLRLNGRTVESLERFVLCCRGGRCHLHLLMRRLRWRCTGRGFLRVRTRRTERLSRSAVGRLAILLTPEFGSPQRGGRQSDAVALLLADHGVNPGLGGVLWRRRGHTLLMRRKVLRMAAGGRLELLRHEPNGLVRAKRHRSRRRRPALWGRRGCRRRHRRAPVLSTLCLETLQMGHCHGDALQSGHHLIGWMALTAIWVGGVLREG